MLKSNIRIFFMIQTKKQIFINSSTCASANILNFCLLMSSADDSSMKTVLPVLI